MDKFPLSMFLFDYSAFKALWISVMGTKKTLQQEIFFHCLQQSVPKLTVIAV